MQRVLELWEAHIRQTSRGLILAGMVMAGGLLAGAGWWSFQQLPALRVGPQAYTVGDLRAVLDFQRRIASISGDTPPSQADIAYALTMTAIEQQGLASQKQLPATTVQAAALDRQAAAFKGLLADTKSRLGEHDYERLIVAPLIIPSLFSQYYHQADSARPKALLVLNQALRTGLSAAAQQAGLPVTRISLAPSPDTIPLAQRVIQRWPDRTKPAPVLDQLVDSPDGFLILQPLSLDKALTVSAIKVPHQTFADFAHQVMRAQHIQVTMPWWSPVSRADLATPEGSIFHAD